MRGSNITVSLQIFVDRGLRRKVQKARNEILYISWRYDGKYFRKMEFSNITIDIYGDSRE